MNRLSVILMSLAIWLLPPNRKAWGEAMWGEFEALSDGRAKFAGGCLTASALENLTNLQGVARIGFLVVAGIAISNVFEGIQHAAFWYNAAFPEGYGYVWQRVNYIVESFTRVVLASIALWMMVKILATRFRPDDLIDLGTRLMVLQVVSLVCFVVFTLNNAMALEQVQTTQMNWRNLTENVPMVGVFLIVGFTGWGSAKRLHVSALVGMLIMTLARLPEVSVFIEPSTSLLAPFSGFLGLESKMIEGKLWIEQPLLSPLNMLMIWAMAFALSSLKNHLGKKDQVLS